MQTLTNIIPQKRLSSGTNNSTMQQSLGKVALTTELGPLTIPLMVSTEQEYQCCAEGALNDFGALRALASPGVVVLAALIGAVADVVVAVCRAGVAPGLGAPPPRAHARPGLTLCMSHVHIRPW